MRTTYHDNLSIVFNITGKRDERPILALLKELNPSTIFLTPNISCRNDDQDNRNNPLSVVSKQNNHNDYLEAKNKLIKHF